MQKILPNFIIAGVHKSGTTSLFHYLNQHPDVLASVDKETNFFIYPKYQKASRPIEEYYQQFEKYAGEKIIMEASPGYFYGGKAIAEVIKEKCNNPKILIILREPTARVISFFNRKREVFQLPESLTLQEYYKQCMNFTESELLMEKNHLYTGFEFGFYIKHIDDWFQTFGSNLKIMFFEDLTNPKKVMDELCDWLGIDKGFYENYDFKVQNKSVNYKNRMLQSVAVKVSFGAQRFWRNNPRLKSTLRGLYYKLNGVEAGKISHDANVKMTIQNMYGTYNKQLATYLREKGYSNLPAWLKE
ncbi:MAG: sulfotransferase [Bacteroidia bacterium]